MVETREGPVVNASELNEFHYCQRAWWLRRVRGLAPTNRDALARGCLLHEDHGRRALRAVRAQRLAILCLALGLLAVALSIGLFLVGGGGYP